MTLSIRKSKNDNVKTIDLNDDIYNSLNPANIPSFNIIENKRICKAYPDGLFPGAISLDGIQQQTSVSNFNNYYEFSKISEDEVRDGYLTVLYYERRKAAWESSQNLKKEHNIVGFVMDGVTYPFVDEEEVNNIIFKNVYYCLVKDLPSYSRLIDEIKKNKNLDLIINEKFYLKCVKYLLKDN